MPHDANGKLLAVGDEVLIRGKVTFIGEADGYCNASVETVHLMPPDNTPASISAINTAQLELVEAVPEMDAFELGKALREREQSFVAGSIGGHPVHSGMTLGGRKF